MYKYTYMYIYIYIHICIGIYKYINIHVYREPTLSFSRPLCGLAPFREIRQDLAGGV